MNATYQPKQIRQQLLNLTKLKPYDVILWKSSGLIADVIAKGTSGAYSHALIVVSNCMYFDARGEGQNFRCFPAKYYLSNSEGQIEVYADVSDLEDLVILRLLVMEDAHPLTLGLLQQQLIERLSDFVLNKYARWWQFGHFAKLPKTFRVIGKLDKAKGFGEEKFCSQLVAEIYEAVGQPLFDTSRPAESISPSDLAGTDLCKVLGCLVKDDECQLIANNVNPLIEAFASIMTRYFMLTEDLYRKILDLLTEAQDYDAFRNQKRSFLPSTAYLRFLELEMRVLELLPASPIDYFHTTNVDTSVGSYKKVGVRNYTELNVGSYKGEMFLHLPHGKGEIEYFPTSPPYEGGARKYVGEWFAGYVHGMGTMYYADGYNWTGEWFLTLAKGYSGPVHHPKDRRWDI